MFSSGLQSLNWSIAVVQENAQPWPCYSSQLAGIKISLSIKKETYNCYLHLNFLIEGVGMSARFRNKYIGCNIVPSLAHGNTSVNSLILLQWTIDLKVHSHCLLKCTETQNNEVLLSCHTELQPHMHVQLLHCSVLGTEPQSLSQGRSPAAFLWSQQEYCHLTHKIFSERPLSFSFLSKSLLGAHYVSVGEEWWLVGLTLPKPKLSFFSFLQMCLSGTKFSASFNDW